MRSSPTDQQATGTRSVPAVGWGNLSAQAHSPSSQPRRPGAGGGSPASSASQRASSAAGSVAGGTNGRSTSVRAATTGVPRSGLAPARADAAAPASASPIRRASANVRLGVPVRSALAWAA